MGELTIKVTDAKLLRLLEEIASVHGTSVEAEAETMLQYAVAAHTDRLDIVKRSREIRAMTPGGVPRTRAMDIINEMREARSRDLGD